MTGGRLVGGPQQTLTQGSLIKPFMTAGTGPNPTKTVRSATSASPESDTLRCGYRRVLFCLLDSLPSPQALDGFRKVLHVVSDLQRKDNPEAQGSEAKSDTQEVHEVVSLTPAQNKVSASQPAETSGETGALVEEEPVSLVILSEMSRDVSLGAQSQPAPTAPPSASSDPLAELASAIEKAERSEAEDGGGLKRKRGDVGGEEGAAATLIAPPSKKVMIATDEDRANKKAMWGSSRALYDKLKVSS
jgi:hypothetical protein